MKLAWAAVMSQGIIGTGASITEKQPHFCRLSLLLPSLAPFTHAFMRWNTED